MLAVAAAVAAWFDLRASWSPQGAVAQAPAPAARGRPVEVAKAVKKSVPIRLEALGTVTPIASVAIKPRIDSEITAVHFARRRARQAGRSAVHPRQPRASRRRSRRPRATSRATRRSSTAPSATSRRYTDLVAKSATPVVNLDNAKTQADTFRAAHQGRPGGARKSEGAAQLLHHPRADLRPHQRRQRQGRQFRARRPISRRSPPSTRSRRSMSASRCRSAAAAICARRSPPKRATRRGDRSGRQQARASGRSR